MEPTELKKRLKALGSEANEMYPSLNYGGCCVFAAAVAKELRDKGIVVEVITTGYGDSLEPLDKIRETLMNNRMSIKSIDNWQRHGVSFGHVAVRFRIGKRWYTYDSDIMRRGKTHFGLPYYKAHPGSYTVEEAIAFASKEDGWNPSFSRHDVPGVRKLVKKHLN